MREIRSKFPAWMIPLFFQEHLAVGPCRLFLRKHNADGVARAFDGRSHRTSVFQDTFTEISNFIEIPIGSGAVDLFVFFILHVDDHFRSGDFHRGFLKNLLFYSVFLQKIFCSS